MRNDVKILGIFLMIFLICFVSAQEVSYCCEKTIDTNPSEDIDNSAWCMDAPQEYCDTNYNVQQSSCQATSFCQKGTCVNIADGTCKENVPKTLCENPSDLNADGLWYSQSADELDQCQLGCCILGEEVSFTTKTGCTSLSSITGKENTFRTDVSSSLECFAYSGQSAKGACVFETTEGRTCTFGTKKECIGSNGAFYDGLLCTNDNLNTNCAPTEKTTCVEKRDEVFFVDTCGNIANVYDASRTADKDLDYWQKVMLPTCANSDGTLNFATCGDCGYGSSGTTCVAYKRTIDGSLSGLKGNYVCRDVNCEDTEFYKRYGRNPFDGESWCLGGTNEGLDGEEELTFSDLVKEENLPGSKDVRMICYNGEVVAEPCYDGREEVCIEEFSDIYVYANCYKNQWEYCASQDNEADCENSEERDCVWVRGSSLLVDENGNELVEEDGVLVSGTEGTGASCVPKFSPGFLSDSEDAVDFCALASRQCIVQYEKAIAGKWKVKDKVICLDNSGKLVQVWIDEMNNVCTAMGDCGMSVNYKGEEGSNEVNDMFTVIGEPGEEEEE